MKPHGHQRLKYLFVVSFGTKMLDLFFFVVHNFYYSCFFCLLLSTLSPCYLSHLSFLYSLCM